MSRRLGAKGHGTGFARFSTPRLGVMGCLLAGADRWRETQIVAMGKSGNGQTEAKAQTILRPIVGLTRTLPRDILESIVIEAIRKHRFLRDLAEIRHAESCRFADRKEATGLVEAAYVRAMIDVHAQQTVLSTLLEVLGYIPEVPVD